MDIEEIKFQINILMIIAFIIGLTIGILSVTITINFSLKPKCKHKNKVLRTIYSSINCETTAEFCQDCAKQLTEAKTDCR